MIGLRDSHAPVSESVLGAFEKRNGVILPDAYRRFLLERNGGWYDDEMVFSCRVEETEAHIRVFYPLVADENSFELDVIQSAENWRGKIPAEFLPVGRDGGGDVVCIGVREPYYGTVWTWDHEGDHSSGIDNMERVCDCFDAFKEGIAYDEEQEWSQREQEFLMAEMGRVNDVKEFLDSGGIPAVRNRDGDSLLHVSAAAGRAEVVQALIDAGTDVELVDALERTALHRSAAGGHVDTTRSLLLAGASVDAMSNTGETPLFFAVRAYAPRVVSLLLDAKANPVHENSIGKSPLDYCFGQMGTECIRPMLERWDERTRGRAGL